MPADYYSDAAEAPEAATTTDKDPQQKEDEGAETTLIPKSICPGKTLEVGEEITLRIVGDHEDQYAVEYADGKGEKKEESAEPAAEPQGDPQMASMME